VVEEVWHSQVGWTRPREFIHTWMEKSLEIVKLWNSWGIPMKYKENGSLPAMPFQAGPSPR